MHLDQQFLSLKVVLTLGDQISHHGIKFHLLGSGKMVIFEVRFDLTENRSKQMHDPSLNFWMGGNFSQMWVVSQNVAADEIATAALVIQVQKIIIQFFSPFQVLILDNYLQLHILFIPYSLFRFIAF